jgi:hypothetical protein
MASDIIQPVAQAIVDVIDDLTPTVNGQLWEPNAGNVNPPAGVVGMPSIDRHDPEEEESQLGATDWFLDFPVYFFHDLGNALYAQEQAVETYEAFVQAVDANPSLGIALVMDAKVTSVTPGFDLDQARPQIVTECRVQVLRLVPNP